MSRVSAKMMQKVLTAAFCIFGMNGKAPRKTLSKKSKEVFLLLCQIMNRSRGMGFFPSVPSN